MKDISSGSFSSLFLLTRQNSSCTVHPTDNEEKKREWALGCSYFRYIKKWHVFSFGVWTWYTINLISTQEDIFIQASYEGGHEEMSAILDDQKHPRICAQIRGNGAGGGGCCGSWPMSTAVYMEPK
jgi:hypothetical protein